MFKRRQFLQMTGAGVALMSQPSLGINQARDPLLQHDGIGLAGLVKSGEVTPKELVEASIRRIEAMDGRLNAVVTRTFEQALERAVTTKPQGPFAGVPFLVKDNLDYEGVKTSHGSAFFKDHVAESSPPLVKAYDAAGLNMLGKTNMPLFGLIPSTESKLWGACHNPWGLDYSAGGSSGGSAAAVAAGYLPFAHATDGGGSIRIPASCCGVFGLKPSFRRLLPSNVTGFRFTQDHCVSRSVRDSASLFAITQDRSPGSKLPPLEPVTGPGKRRLKIGLCTIDYFGEEAHPDVKAAIEETAKLCESLGHEIVMVDNPINGPEFVINFQAEFAQRIIALKTKIEKETGQPISESGLLSRFADDFALAAMSFPDDAAETSRQYMIALEQQVQSWMSPVDLLLTPVLKTPPVKLGYLYDNTQDYEVMSHRIYHYLSYTPVQNALGMPAMSVPLGMSSKGLPIGSQFIARVGDERTLFELAYELEAASPWADKWPPYSIAAL